MTGYKRIQQDAQVELLINKSRFLGYAYVIQDTEHAETLIKALKKPHSTATHICYGYVADTLGNVARFSDDGEPQGTAGLPILDVLKKQELKKTLVAVVRYFGGIKLGAGGLVRAYSAAAAQAVLLAGTTVIKEQVRLELILDYADHTRLSGVLGADSITIEARDFADCVTLTLSVDKAAYPEFLQNLSSILGKDKDTILKGIVKEL